jgi:hypothetical protein
MLGGDMPLFATCPPIFLPVIAVPTRGRSGDSRWPPQAGFDCAGTLCALKTLTDSFTLRSTLKAAHGALCSVPIRLQAACHGRCAGVEKN